jgi:hypothetical protein
MNKIIIAIILLLIVMSATFFFFQRDVPSQTPGSDVNQQPIEFPIGDPQGGGEKPVTSGTDDDPIVTEEESVLTIQGRGGEKFTVPNFFQSGVAKEDVMNKGTYYLGNVLPVDITPGFKMPSYTVTYYPSSHYFNVVLYTKPLRQARNDAETFLRKTLNMQLSNLCSLDYSVSVPGFVDKEYTSRDLRFSACPSATPLP